jgi:hypothetical protein
MWRQGGDAHGLPTSPQFILHLEPTLPLHLDFPATVPPYRDDFDKNNLIFKF